jgi:thymidylate kinase
VTAGLVTSPVAATYAALDDRGVSWAVLRGTDHPRRVGGDIDLLVSPRDADAFAAEVMRCGFVEVRRSGHGSHRFFVTYDAADQRWIELDVVTRVAYGRHQEIVAVDADIALARRRRQDGRWLLDASDAFWALLLHYALDGARLDPGKRDDLAAHAAVADVTGPVAAAVNMRLPSILTMFDLLDVARARDVARLDEALLTVHGHWHRRERTAALVRAGADRLRSRLPRIHKEASEPGIVVAVLGPDGAGKSTLVAALRHAVPLPTRSFYLGVLRTTNRARRLRRVPGLMLVSRLATFGTRGAVARYHARRGRLVLFDRYSYDALLPVARAGIRGRLSSALILRLCPAPDLVMVLDVPAEVMFARKGELGEAQLEDFRHRYLAMSERIAGAVVVDGSRSPEEVQARATALIWRALATPQPA